jgi:hypothetical protein
MSSNVQGDIKLPMYATDNNDPMSKKGLLDEQDAGARNATSAVEPKKIWPGTSLISAVEDSLEDMKSLGGAGRSCVARRRLWTRCADCVASYMQATLSACGSV